MSKRQFLRVSTVAVLIAFVAGTGCARGPLRPWWRKKEPEPPKVVRPVIPPPPKVVEEGPIKATELTAPGKEEPPVRAEVFELWKELEMIHFEFDKSRITEEARLVLQQNAEKIKAHPDDILQIEGHCDERGTNEYNLALGHRRAQSTRNYLINLGVNPGQLATISYGEEKALDPRHNEEAWAKNRRAQFNRAQ